MAGKKNSDRKRPQTESTRHSSSTKLLDFIEWRRFSKDWQTLRLNDEALNALQLAIISEPCAGVLVEGTGGLRKLRFAPPAWKTGKSGATRICYVYFEDHALVYLLRAYAKNEKDDLDASEKAAIKKLILGIAANLAQRAGGGETS